jgi:hypothetical protein
MTEIVKDLKLTGCEQITLDTCTLDASSTANTLAVSNDIISLGSKVSIAASLGNVRIGPHQTLQSEPTTRWPCRRERYHITFERRYEMERIRILVPLRRRSPVERSRHRHHSERRAFRANVRAGALDDGWRTEAPIVSARFSHVPHLSPNILNQRPYVQQFGRATGERVGSCDYKRVHRLRRGFSSPPVRFAGSFAQDSGHTERSAAYELEGVIRTEALPSSVWEELGRAGFKIILTSIQQTAYDCYRIVVTSQ